MRVLLLTAAAFFACGTALAQVQGYVVINPIAICDSNGNCPIFGMQCGLTNGTYGCTSFNSPSAANKSTQSQLSTPIGFVNSDCVTTNGVTSCTSINLLRANLARLGVDAAFFPIQQWNSDAASSPNANKNPWTNLVDPTSNPPLTFSYNSTTWQHLHNVNIQCNAIDPTTMHPKIVTVSPDLQALTQIATCQGNLGGPVSMTVASANPPLSSTGGPVNSAGQSVPLASRVVNGVDVGSHPLSNAIDMFFLTDITSNTISGITYGFSWINHNGVAIGRNVFVPGGAGSTPHFTTIHHETGHALALTHTDYGAGGSDNMMSSPRTEASTAGCSGPGSSTGGTNGGLLYDLANPSAIPANPVVPCTPAMTATVGNLKRDAAVGTDGTACAALDSTCTSEQGAALLSGFINMTLATSATAGGGASTSAAISTASSPSGGSTGGSGGGTQFRINTVAGTGEPSTATSTPSFIRTVAFALKPESNLAFQGSTPATNTCSPTDPSCVQFVSQLTNNGNTAAPPGNDNCSKNVGLAAAGWHCLFLTYPAPTATTPGLTAGNHSQITINIAQNDKPLTNINALAGSQFSTESEINSTIGSGGQNSLYATTAAFELDGSGTQTADNQFPVYTVPNMLIGKFVGATNIPCGLEQNVTMASDCKKGELPQGPIVTTGMNPTNCTDLSTPSVPVTACMESGEQQ
jgi:hypothetical protein